MASPHLMEGAGLKHNKSKELCNEFLSIGKNEEIVSQVNKILGNDGLPFIGDLNLTNIKKAFYYKLIESRKFDDDVFELRRLV